MNCPRGRINGTKPIKNTKTFNIINKSFFIENESHSFCLFPVHVMNSSIILNNKTATFETIDQSTRTKPQLYSHSLLCKKTARVTRFRGKSTQTLFGGSQRA